MDSKDKKKYITLKEAAKISGYSADYVGQLIRKGKLPGKQVYYNIAWLTTEKAVKEYMLKAHNTSRGNKKLNGKISEMLYQFKRKFFLDVESGRMLKRFLLILIVLFVIFFLFLFYIFSVNLDNKLNKKAVDRKIETPKQLNNTGSFEGL